MFVVDTSEKFLDHYGTLDSPVFLYLMIALQQMVGAQDVEML